MCRRVPARPSVDSGDIADLRHVQKRSDTRRDVLTVSGRRSKYMRIILRDIQHRAFDIFCEAFGELRRIGEQHLADARHLRRCIGCTLRI